MVVEKFDFDDFFVVTATGFQPQLIKAETCQEAEDIFDEYNRWDLDYMAGRTDNITGSRKASNADIVQLIGDGYLVRTAPREPNDY